MINPEVAGIKVIPLTPEYISNKEKAHQEGQSGVGRRSAKQVAVNFVGDLRHHWGLRLPKGTDDQTREDLLAARERGQVVVYKRGGLRRGSIRLAERILSITSEGERFTDGADFKESTTHVLTHPILSKRFRNGTSNIYFAADLRGTAYQDSPPKRIRRQQGSVAA